MTKVLSRLGHRHRDTFDTLTRSILYTAMISNLHKHLRKAAGSKDETVLPTFIREHSITLAELDDVECDGRGALHMACWTGCISNVELLLRMGCNIDTIATRSHNYGKSPIFFSATRSREDVMNLLLDRGANVLIVNNKGQSVYSIACSHFGEELVQRIVEVEKHQMAEAEKTAGEGLQSVLPGWVDYSKSHPDGNIYGDLDARFIGRDLTPTDVLKDGVVNPTTKESRKGNFAKNNPHAFNSRKKKKGEAKARKRTPPPEVFLSDEETKQVEKIWDQVEVQLRRGDSRELFMALLKVVQLCEKLRSSWVKDSSTRLRYILNSEEAPSQLSFDVDYTTPSLTPDLDFSSVISDAIVCCSGGDRHTTLVKRILTNAQDSNEEHTRQNSNFSKDERTTKAKTKDILPQHYNSVLRSVSSNDELLDCLSWQSLMVANGQETYLSLSEQPTFIDSVDQLHELQDALTSLVGAEETLHGFISFDTEFTTLGEETILATFQLSVLSESKCLKSWVIDLLRSDDRYQLACKHFLQWLFLENEAFLLGFSFNHDIKLISNYIAQEIEVNGRFLDLQLICAQFMPDGARSHLPGLQSSCSFFTRSIMHGGEQWVLSKEFQCSDWARRPLSTDQLAYAGLDAAVLLVLLASIVR